jgi:hypothetical protein
MEEATISQCAISSAGVCVPYLFISSHKHCRRYGFEFEKPGAKQRRYFLIDTHLSF